MGRGSTRNGRGSAGDQRRELAERLRARSPELEEMIFDRICALEGFPAGPHQLRGLREVVRSSVEHGLVAVELGERRSPEPPPAVIAHARKAAWRSVSTPTLHERYTAGYSIFRNFLLREAGSVDLACEIQISTDVVFERLTSAVREEHEREAQKRSRSGDACRLERVQGLLSGELIEVPELAYPFDSNHLGLVASGPQVVPTISHLAKSLGAMLLVVHPTPHEVWAWIGSKGRLASSDISNLLESRITASCCICIGESARKLSGWRKTHSQANAAFALRGHGERYVSRYIEVAMLASAVRDDLLRTSLHDNYLAPLAASRDGGAELRATLRAYFATHRNSVSAAAVLGVTRQTVRNRLQTVEEILGRPLQTCAAELELALELPEVHSDTYTMPLKV